jgi:membrane-associated phospholipid phosphatase
MFQTEPILFLQSFASDGLTLLMEAITQTGYETFVIGVLIIIITGVSLRKGFILFQILLWTYISTQTLKRIFALPRPIYVDSNIQNLGIVDKYSLSEFINRGAEGFFEPLKREVVVAYRLRIQNNYDVYGLPSGHVSSATALWGGLALLFRHRVLYWIAPAMIVLMALSRMYFGRHFLADVMGGMVVGVAMLFVAYQLLTRYQLQQRFFERASFALAVQLPNILFFIFLFVAPLLVALTSTMESDKLGYLLGVNTAFLVVILQGLPDDSGTLWQRAARVLLGFLLFFVVNSIVDLGINLSGINDDLAWVEFIEAAIPSFMALWGLITISVKLGLYKRENVLIEEE